MHATAIGQSAAVPSAEAQSASSESAQAQATAPPSGQPQFRDELIYELVKFEGKSQGWVASELGISQGTVSRAIQRIERRQAQPDQPDAQRDPERFDPEERLRVQRWLTYERNERILASCLRIAHDVEGFLDVSRTTIQRDGLAGGENKVQTVHATLDRSGTAARFLRLAFQINMEQLQLVETEAEEALPPLAVEQASASPISTSPTRTKTANEALQGDCEGKLAELETKWASPATSGAQPSAAAPCNEAQSNGAQSNGATVDRLKGATAEQRPIASNGQATNGHAANGNGAGGHAHSAHERIPGVRDVSASLPETYAANGHAKNVQPRGA